MDSTDQSMHPSRRLLDPNHPKFVLQLSLLGFVVVVHSDARRALAGALLAIVGLMVGNLVEKAWFWWLTTGIMGVWFLLEWQLLDNHVALSVYWAAAAAIALGSSDYPRILAQIGRWTIVTVFSLAVFWKVVSPDFLSGAFFEWTLLVDPRFVPLAEAVGMAEASLTANRALVGAGGDGSLMSDGTIAAVALILTVGTLLAESAVVLLWTIGRRLGNLRHWALGFFAFTTYVVVPVAGFGFMLLVVGMATVDSAIGRRNYAYGALALFVYSAVWNWLVLGG